MLEAAFFRIRNQSIDYDWKIAAMDPALLLDAHTANKQTIRDFYHEKGKLSPSEDDEVQA